MENRERRARGSNWNHAHTVALAELKRDASLNEEGGRLGWERIAQTLSSRFPDQIRPGAQCRMRWDTLVKAYNRIENFRVVTGMQDHRELDEDELASMELATAYHPEWYDIVKQVCSQRKRKQRCDRDLMPAKRSKGSHSVELPEHPPNRDTLGSASTSKSVTPHEQSTPDSTTQVSSSTSLESDKLVPEEEAPRLKNGNDGLMLEHSATAYAQVSSSPSLVLEATQLRQHGLVSHEVSQEPQTLESANLLPHTSPAEDGAQLAELPLVQDDFIDSLWAFIYDPPSITPPTQIMQLETESEWTEHFFRDFEFEPGVLPEILQPKNRGRNPTVAANAQDGGMINLEDSILTKDDGAMGYWTRTNDDDSTIPRQNRRLTLKVTLFLRPCRLAGDCKTKARKKALMSRKENIPAMLNAASATSATSATRGDKRFQKDPQRTLEQAALDKKEEETMPTRAERQQLGGKSSSMC